MDLQKTLESLSPLERSVLPFIKDGSELHDISKASGMTETEVMRGLQWLENKGIARVVISSRDFVDLGENGKLYAKGGLPEKRFLSALAGKMTLDELKRASGLADDEMMICIGILKSKYAISLLGNVVEPTGERERILKEGLPEERLLGKLPAYLDDFSDEEKSLVARLLGRKDIIRKYPKKLRHAELTGLGKKVAKALKEAKIDLAESLTPQMLREKSWHGKKFRRYDIKTGVPKINPGKRQPYSEFLQNVRRKLVALGFSEMQGPVIELEFFNFDALFQPQNHPARDWSATYSIKSPRYGRLPKASIVKNVKAAHENGWKTGSTGWGYKWSEKIASQLTARAHDTAISPRFLAKGVKIPGKYFSLVRCFRPDVIDATHGVEFNQLGGFVIGRDLSFRNLLGLLQGFVYETTGIEEVKFLPDYFPFTEPSVQVSARHPKFGWIELAGAGVFRPELTRPLGVDEPVIAWGFGLDRLAMMKLNIKDIRDIFSGDIEFLRKSRKVL